MNYFADKYVSSFGLNNISVDNVGGSLFGCFMLDPRQEVANMLGSSQQPIRFDAGAVCICLRGHGHVSLNGNHYDIARGDMTIIFPRTLVQNASSDPEFLGYAVAINTEFMVSIRARSIVQSYVSLRENPIIHLDDGQISTIIELCEMLKAKDKRPDHYYHNEISRALLSIISYEIHDICLKQQSRVNVPRSRQDVIFQNFLDLVEKNYSSEREIGYYAEKLFITQKYLSVVVKNISGVSPTEWINRSVLLSAKALLATTDLTVQQISTELNFPNPSFFGQYFKRNIGVTPKHYRLQSKS